MPLLAFFVPVPIYPPEVDVDGYCKNFVQDANGAWRAMTNNANAIKMLGAGVNYIAGSMPRTLVGQTESQVTSYDSGTTADPLYHFRVDDSFENAHYRRIHVIALPRTNGTGDAYFENETTTDRGATTGAAVASQNFPQDIFYESVDVRRDGAWSAGEANDGLSVFNGYTILAMSVEELPVNYSANATDVPQRADWPGPFSGSEIEENRIEKIRDVLHQCRQNNMPTAFSYMSQANGASWATPTGTSGQIVASRQAITVRTTTLTNVIDQSSTTRTATTPGVNCYAIYSGVGEEDTTDGGNVRVQCRVFGAMSSGSATVRFIGPNHVGSNQTDITINNATPQWWGGASNFIYLNSAADDDNTTLARNKIDIHASVDNVANSLYIYTMTGFEDYF